MGGKGFPPAPTALKAIRGNPGRRPLNRREPKPPADDGVPAPPAYLSDVERVEWTRIVPDLAECGLLTRIDHAALEGYCATRARVLGLETELRGEKPVLRTKKGYPVLNPTFTALQSEYKQLMRFFAEFGMTPASRSRIQVEKPEPLSDLEAFRRKHDG
jgi:P27 family predicted phage terminase small subunit